MNKKEVIKDILKGFPQYLPKKVIHRNIELPLNSNKVISIIGARRAGKTFLMYEAINELLSNGLQIQRILFFSCEDERLQMDISEMDLVVQAYTELYPDLDQSNTYWFFDEIQNIPGWERFIRRVYDTITRNVFISGSNSKLLGTEISTSMRGRTLSIEVFPLSFAEYLRFNNISDDYYGTKNKAVIVNYQNKYLYEGSFPELTLIDNQFKINLLQEYYHLMLYHDLIERYNVQNIIAMKYLIGRMLVSIGKPYPANRIYNELKSKGIKISKTTLYQYVEYIQTVYMVFQLTKYDASFIKQETSEKKIFFIDTGLLHALSPVPAENKGMLLENTVFLYLRKKYGSFMLNNLFYYKTTTECDFIVFDRTKPMYCIQVSYDISDDKTRKREIKGLLAALKHFNLSEGYILTAEQEEEITIDSKKIKILPAYKLMIDNELK